MKLPALRLESMLMLGTALLLACIAMFAGTWVHYIRTSDVDWDYVKHTREVIQKLDELKISLLELENSERGYLITGRDGQLERNAAAKHSFSSMHADLAKMVADNPEQVKRIRAIEPLFGDRVISSGQLLELRDNLGLGATQPVLVAGLDKVQSDKIDTLIDAMLQEELRLLDIRRQKLRSTLDRRKDLALVGMIIIMGLLCGLGYAVRLDLRLRAEHMAKLDQIAHSDMLTGLANRRHFVSAGLSLLALSQRNQKMTAVLMLDLDGFKGVNDSLGHEAGDVLLAEVAKRLTQTVRSSDVVARLGGDEFVIMLSEVSSIEGVKTLAQKLVEVLGDAYLLNGQRCTSVGTSVGLAWSPDHGEDIHALMRHADMALYAAKRAGKRQYAVYESRMSTE